MMKGRFLWIAVCFGLAPAALHAQSASTEPQPSEPKAAAPSLRDQLMPPPAQLMVTAPVIAESKSTQPAVAQPVMANGGSGVGYMIAGAALFVAGLLVDNSDAGTVLVLAGAGIGAYGLYLHFR